MCAQRILVDDSDPALKYSSGWSASSASDLNSLGNYGPIWASTTHATQTDGASVTFSFSGTTVEVFGTINILNTNGVITPSWTCVVDGTALAEQNPTFQYPENNWNLCGGSVPAGSHTLVITAHTTGRPFYVDFIMYTPTASVNLDGAVMEYMNTDAAVSFAGGWQLWGAQNVTQSSGASVSIDFHGTAIVLTAYVPHELPGAATSASYSLDGGADTTFTLAGIPADSATVYNVPILSLPNLSAAQHKLVVTHHGDGSHTPLPVGQFFVTNAVLAAPAPPPPGSPTPAAPQTSVKTTTKAVTATFTSGGATFTSTFSSAVGQTVTVDEGAASSGAQTGPATGTGTSAPDSTLLSGSTVAATKHSTPLGAIVGGIVAVVALLLIAGGIFFWCRRRRRRGVALPERDPAVSASARAGAPSPFLMSEAGSSAYASSAGRLQDTTYGSGYASVSAYRAESPAPFSTPSGSASGSASNVGSESPYGPLTASSPYGGIAPATSSPFVPVSASPFVPVSSKHAEARLTPQRRPVVVQQAVDSGVRLPDPRDSLLEPEIVELPPGYSRE